MDQGLLWCNIDNEDNIYLYCLSCTYKKNMGIELYDRIKSEVTRISGN